MAWASSFAASSGVFAWATPSMFRARASWSLSSSFSSLDSSVGMETLLQEHLGAARAAWPTVPSSPHPQYGFNPAYTP
ncbi:hypothetical protein [Pyxidicoccus xibeiensis]|uniref:hypothetical protein n=1 Tax=Pyxidicoccus xibeiensis TaxID=2906759 RepID=UPI0020A72F83|nr:hypothetical protein [Pyxidicoccus xibeiensis]MCP3140548.1 hypothetical protein [Pyxidicoccus xibeiensis]